MFPDKVVFNHKVRLDLMYLDGRQVLHIVDVGANFSAAQFLNSQGVNSVWNSFLTSWSTTYYGYPESILTDQGSVFFSSEWESACQSAPISLRHTGTESHNSLGSDETYHSMLRRIYKKFTLEFLDIPAEFRLALSIKAMNDNAGPEGYVPSLLVFGVLPRIPLVKKIIFKSGAKTEGCDGCGRGV